MNIQTPQDLRRFRAGSPDLPKLTAQERRAFLYVMGAQLLSLMLGIAAYLVAIQYPQLKPIARAVTFVLFPLACVLLIWISVATRGDERRRALLIGAAGVVFVLGAFAFDLGFKTFPDL